MSPIWEHTETDYPGHPGEFSAYIDETEDDGVGNFIVVGPDEDRAPLFDWMVKLPAPDASEKTKKTFETDMVNLMHGVIELKS